tara:strand:- start:635 stop:1759 length:1125 start_codon:yes stop_codon:yes gene_type:complete
MGLLTDTYGDILKKLQGIDNRADNDFSDMDSDFNSSLGDGIKASLAERKGGSPLTKKGGELFPTSIVPQNILNQNKTNKIPKQNAKPSDPIVMGGSGTQYSNDNNFLSKLANLAGTDLDKAMATWKDKGGFEGLMSNPAFTIGLAFLQAGAEGKSLGQGALDNVIKAGAVSQQYKKILDARKEAPIQATAADISETKNLLSKVGISEGNWFENFGSKVSNFFNKNKGSRNPGLDYDKAVEEIAVQYQAAVRKKQAQLKAAGKPQILRVDDKIKIMEQLIKSGVIQKNESFFSKLGITDATIQKREQGGPINAGQPYLVGEKGPEIVIPHSSGNVVANDDSQVFNMLLASNPQLQKVSKERAMKILKAKFPEYFD